MNYKRLTSISYGHFSIDILNSSIAIILTSVSNDFGLSVSQIGFGAMIYTFAAAFSQPLFGLVADRLRGRWLGAIGLAWTIAFYALAAFSPNYPVLITLLTIGALGSGAFHPVGIVNAADAGGDYPTSSTSIFFLLGQSGLALGPIVSGLVLQNMGLSGLPYIALAMTPAVIMMAVFLNEPMADSAPEPEAKSAGDAAAVATPTGTARPQVGRFVITAFVLAIALRATTIQSFAVLLPKYFDNLGYTSGEYGLMLGIFTMGGALGTLSGGIFGDRFERRTLMVVALLLSVPFSLALLNTQGMAYFVAAFLAGGLLNVPHSIMLIIGQELLPKRKGFIGGAVLGFMFASGAGMAWVASWFADWVGLGTVLTLLAFFPIAAAAITLVLPRSRSRLLSSAESIPTAASGD
jgi:FSR family fosmidomycin resistance protein-like MFS transporter